MQEVFVIAFRKTAAVPEPIGWLFAAARRVLAGRLGLIAAAAIVLAAILVPASATNRSARPLRAGGPPVPPKMALVSYSSCADLLAGLRAHTAKNLSALGSYSTTFAEKDGGLPGGVGQAAGASTPEEPMPVAAAAAPASTPDHSSTNVQEIGVDEPDIVKTDGRRIVTLQGGVLRVVDAATRTVTGTLDISQGSDISQGGGGGAGDGLLLAGDRALVIMAPGYAYPPGYAHPAGAVAPVPGPAGSSQPSGPVAPRSRFVLVDLSGAPKVVGSLAASGDYVDARMVGTTARLVSRSTPTIAVPNVYNPSLSNEQVIANASTAVRKAPLSAWLPTYDVTMGNTMTTRSVPCGNVSHPADYTGTSLLTIYTIDVSKPLGDASPVTLAADGTTVYGTASSLYIASNPASVCCLPMAGVAAPGALPKPALEQTEIHRFSLPSGGRPVYLGSGTVPGRLLNQYSISDFDGHLRIATTSGTSYYAGAGQASNSSSAVYVLDDATLAVVGSVGGLGNGEQIYAVRFSGPLAYVVTFQRTDPLYVLDLTTPTAPRATGALDLTGYSNYLQQVGDGRVIGVGQEANSEGRVAGMQVSLFDVSSPSAPRRIGHVYRPDAPGESSFDPHSFLYWPATDMVIVPIDTWSGSSDGGKALVLRIAASGLGTVGLIGHPPSASQPAQNDLGIERSLVIGTSIWTMSPAGLLASNLTTLSDQAWLPFA